MNEPHKSLKIESPCHMKWGELEGSGSRRWCDQCALHVVDGSSMTKQEATQLVEASDERVCMRVVKDDQGRVVHASGGAAARLLRYGLTAAAGVLAACADERGKGAEAGTASTPDAPDRTPVSDPDGGIEPVRPEEIMGEICFVEEMGRMVTEPPEEVQEEEDSEPAESEEAPGRVLLGKVRLVEGADLPPADTSDGE